MICIQVFGLLISTISFATAAPSYHANPPPCYGCSAPAPAPAPIVQNVVLTSTSVAIVNIVQTKTEQVIVTQTSTAIEQVVITQTSTAVAVVSSTIVAYVSQQAIAIATPSPIAYNNVYQPTPVIQPIATPLPDCDDQPITSYVNTPQGYPSNQNPSPLVSNNQLVASASLSPTLPTVVPQLDVSVTSASIDSLVASTSVQSISSTPTNDPVSLQTLASSAFGFGASVTTFNVLFGFAVLSILI